MGLTTDPPKAILKSMEEWVACQAADHLEEWGFCPIVVHDDGQVIVFNGGIQLTFRLNHGGLWYEVSAGDRKMTREVGPCTDWIQFKTSLEDFLRCSP